MVAASGNINPLSWQELLYGCPVAYPGAYPQVLSTTFTNGNNALTGYSCTGPEVDFAAPGDQIYSTVPTGPCMFCAPQGYSSQSGTSMASPHLAGTVALLLSRGIADAGAAGLLDDVRTAICESADTGFGVNSTPIPESDPRYPKYFGCGVINADGAVLTPPPANAMPTAVDDAATTAEDNPVSISILANDSDADNDPLIVSGVGQPSAGTAVLNAAGTAIDYAPAANAHGVATFTYTVSDGHGGTDSATVTVTVTPVNDDPVAVDDTLSTNEGAAAASVDVLANDTDVDGDSLAVSGLGQPAHGTAIIEPGGTIAYTPDAGYSGSDAFGYSLSDGAGGTDTGAVAVTVGAVDDPPTAAPAAASTTAPNPVSIRLSAVDPDTCELTFQVVDLPAHGGVGALTNGPCSPGTPNADAATVVYTPDAGYSGADSFTYRALDASGASAVATVTLTVAAGPALIHVGDLDGSTASAGKTWTARVTIRIETAAHGAVSGAIVTGTWSNGATGTASCTTGTAGTCSVQKTKLTKATVASITFTVTSVTRAGNAYAPGANHDPETDSDGTLIVVSGP